MKKKTKIKPIFEPVTAEPVTDEIEVGDPQLLRPVELPLVVKLPASASKAQFAYAKVLNAYAYSSSKKWGIKKDGLIARLKELKNAPDPIESEYGLKIGMKNPLE